MTAGAKDALFWAHGVIFSRTSTRSLINGIPYEGVTRFDFSHTRQRVVVPSQRIGAPPLGIADGGYMPESWSLEMLTPTAELIKQSIGVGTSKAVSYGDAAPFSYQLSIGEAARQMPTITFVLDGMQIEEEGFGLPDGAGALTTKFSGKFVLASTTAEGGPLQRLKAYLSSLQQ